MFNRILVPVDGSTASNAGLDTAIRLAGQAGATIRLVHVSDPFRLTLGKATISADLVGMIRERGERILADARGLVEQAGVPVEAEVIEKRGSPVGDLIVRETGIAACDLIVLGTHGRRGLQRLLLGSEAEQVIRRSLVPVLLVRSSDSGKTAAPAVAEGAPRPVREAASRYGRILVPVDGSEPSTLGVDEAIRLARHSGGAIRLLHVLDELVYLSGFETGAAYVHSIVPKLQAFGEEILAAARVRVQAAGVPVETMLVDCFGMRAADRVVEQVRDWNADVIVIGTHGRRGVRRLMLGSDAERIVRQSTVPVLLVRAKEPNEATLPVEPIEDTRPDAAVTA